MPSSAYVAALYVEHGLVSTAVADVTGRVIAEAREDTNGEGDPVELVRSAVDRACRRAGVSVSMLSAFVVGSPGIVDPATGDPRLAYNLPAWHEGVRAGLRGALHKNVLIENDVNLAAIAERAAGAAAGADDFVLLWTASAWSRDLLGGRLHRALPAPPARSAGCRCRRPVTSDVRYPAGGGLQWLAAGCGPRHRGRIRLRGAAAGGVAPGTVCPVRRAGGPRRRCRAPARRAAGAAGLGHPGPPQGERGSSTSWPGAALGATAVCTSIDPGLVVLGGEVGLAAAWRSPTGWPAEALPRICPGAPVVPTALASEPVLRGAMLPPSTGRADLLAWVAWLILPDDFSAFPSL